MQSLSKLIKSLYSSFINKTSNSMQKMHNFQFKILAWYIRDRESYQGISQPQQNKDFKSGYVE